ncbi:MAG: ABC transporter permease [Halobellus sp.]|uniref:ABC transporter permease n=1 Tax=Halobellus sp. TaxID=1979212 RepID=UPI0035D49E5E
MPLREVRRLAWRAITAHRLRSVLTVLGVVVGIGSVIAFATFGASVQAEVVSQFQGTGASEIYVTPGAEDGGPPGDDFTRPAFTTHDVDELRAIEGVKAVVPRGIVPTSSVTFRGQTLARSRMTATTEAAFSEDVLVSGRSVRAGADEIVVNEAAATVFERNLTVGSTVTVAFGDRTQNVTVVGIVSGTRGSVTPAFASGTPRFYLPADPFYRTVVESPTLGVDQRAYPQVTVVATAGQTESVKQAVEASLSNGSDAAQLLPPDTEIGVRSRSDIVESVQSVIDRITRFVTGVAVLSLIVGAFGIANIMLVSVTQRTREIGVMKAVGATNREVMTLFLAESVTLSGAGALAGIPVGLGVGYAAARYAEVGFTLSLEWIGIAVGIGLFIGVVAGLYPAWRAARVDPIDALRYE